MKITNIKLIENKKKRNGHIRIFLDKHLSDGRTWEWTVEKASAIWGLSEDTFYAIYKKIGRYKK